MPPTPARNLRFERVAQENLDAAWRVARRCGVHGDQVADVVQEVFLVVSKRLHEISPDRERAFVVGTTVKVAANWRRSHKRRREDALSEDPSKVGLASEPAQEAEARRRRGIELLDEALQRMTQGQREIFVMTELEQLTAREIAQQLNMEEAAVVSRLRRAREAFQLFCDTWQSHPQPAWRERGAPYDA
jgi:RNA polymerase sigma-70 factor, ECF subfamily